MPYELLADNLFRARKAVGVGLGEALEWDAGPLVDDTRDIDALDAGGALEPARSATANALSGSCRSGMKRWLSWTAACTASSE